MKNNYILLSTLSLFAMHGNELAEKNLTINSTTYLTFRRYYYIARLEKTINLIAKINQATSAHRMQEIINKAHFQNDYIHPLLHNAMSRIKNTKSIMPIFAIWEDFSSYKSLNAEIVIGKNDFFVKEFSQQLFFVTKALTNEKDPLSPLEYVVLQKRNELPTETILSLLDELTDRIEYNTSIRHVPSDKGTDIKVNIDVDAINFRFYLIKRLEKSINLFDFFKKNDAQTYDLCIKKSYKKLIARNIIHNQYVSEVLERSEEESLDPINFSWQDIKQYRKVNDKNFTKDVCIVLFNVAKNIYKFYGDKEHPSTAQIIIEKSDIEDILDAIDIVTAEMEIIANDYKKTSSGILPWLKQKWWLPLCAFGRASLKIMSSFITKNHD